MERQIKFDNLAFLLEYPARELDFESGRMRSFVDVISDEAATHIDSYIAGLSGQSLDVRQEMFVRTFDMNPDCALEIGWHLFGEDYKRGEMLAYLRREMRSVGIEEGTELPDYLGNVLKLLGRWNQEDAGEFVTMFLGPALEKMKKAVSATETPYLHLFEAIEDVCVGEFAISA